MRNNVPSNTDNTIDSREIIARIDELTSERAELDDTLTAAIGEEYNTLAEIGTDEREAMIDAIVNARDTLADWDTDNADELRNLESLAYEADGSGDWKYGETLIRDSYFEDYARQIADDVCDMTSAKQWPFTCIDWAEAARELQQDYTSVDFDGKTYWIRS